MTTDSLILPIALPLLGALLATALPRIAPLLGVLAALSTALSGLWLTGQAWVGGDMSIVLGGRGLPLGIGLAVDGLSAALLSMSSLVGLGISVYAVGYFAGTDRERHFWPLWLLLWTALNGVFLAADLFNLYVMLELLGLGAAALGALTGTREAIAANLRYLLVGLLGSITYLLGVALIYTGYGTLDIGLLSERIQPSFLAATALVLMTAGLALKAALFPLHFWLPPAHANAPAPVSAALSALVVKAAFYLILRLWMDLFANVTDAGAAFIIGALGAGAVLWGSWRALRAARLKLLAAYSTVAQIGYLFLFFPLLQAMPAGPARNDLFAACVLMAVTHGFAKAGFFLAAGLVQKKAGHDRIDELGGAAQSMPATTFSIALAGSALIGLPPSGSFIAKWVMMRGAFETGQWWWLIVVGLGTLLAAAYIFRVLSRAFGLEPTPQRFVTDARAEIPALLLALASVVLLGLAAGPIWSLLGFDGVRT